LRGYFILTVVLLKNHFRFEGGQCCLF